jgi:hypothetical protein
MKNYKIVEVEWKDITFYSGHYKIEDIKEYGLKHFKTIGYLIVENKEFIQIALTKETTEEDTVADIYMIPKVNIIKRRIFKND